MKKSIIKPIWACGKTGREKTIAFGFGTSRRRASRAFIIALNLFFVYITIGFEVEDN